ncbi:response regulator transcription factor [Methylobacterium sp. P31]
MNRHGFWGSRMPVFMVDDDAEILNSARFMLEGEGYPVATFESGRQLLAALPAAKPCCIVIDYLLPDMTGLDACERLRALGVTAPVIIITGHPSPMIREKVQEAGLPLVEKPLVDELLSTIEATGPLH